MKKYKEYMDGVRASNALHQRLVGLEASGKRPIPWKKYGAVAAALALVVGVGGFGAWAAHINGLKLPIPFYPIGYRQVNPEMADAIEPDIAPIDRDDVVEPGEKTIGGYEVVGGEMTTYYVLPYIDYGDSDDPSASSAEAAMMDWDIPLGAARRDLTQAEIIALLGGGETVSTHLDWGGYELTGWAAWYEDGSFWGAYINGIRVNAALTSLPDSFEFAVTAGQLPPTCFGYPTDVTQEVRGLTVTAGKYCTPTAVSVPAGTDAPEWANLMVNFMKDDYGYRFEMRSIDAGLAEEMVSRLVCCVADNRLDLSVVGGTIPEFVPDYDPACEDGVSGDAPDICGYPLNPNEAADPTCNTPVPEDGSSINTVGSIVPSMYQPAPPTLRVLCPEGLVDGRSGNYEWSYTEPGSGATASVVACGLHPLEAQDIPSLTTADGTVTLDFFDLPDRVSVVCWPDSERGNTSAPSQTAQVSRSGQTQTYTLTLKEGGWIYEVSAKWDDQGTASYVFYLIKD